MLFTSHARKNYFQVPIIHKKQIFHHLRRIFCAQAHQNECQLPQYSQFPPKKLQQNEKKNLTFAPKAVTITLWSLKVGIDLLCE